MSDISQMTPNEAYVRLEDVVTVLDDVGVPGAPDFDTPAQRVRALADHLAESLAQRDKVLGVATALKDSVQQSALRARTEWFKFPEVTPPDDRDVVVYTEAGKQVVVRYDAKPTSFFTTCGTRIWIKYVVRWRECAEGPTV